MNGTIRCPDFQEQAERIPREHRSEFYDAVKEELLWCTIFAQRAESPSISFSEIREAGGQLILEFTVTDLGKKKKNEYNWHGQNTSRWVYAGCVLYDKATDSISRHH